MKLKKHEVTEDVVLKEKHVHNIEDAWRICLIGYILEKFLGVKAIEKVYDFWKSHINILYMIVVGLFLSLM